jgi:hypothetical protein
MRIIHRFLDKIPMGGFFKQKPHRILVTGNPKTGTTALYHSIRYALPSNSLCLFEPENKNIQPPKAVNSPILIKSFVPVSSMYDDFEKKILIVRDPRDHLISTMLYMPYNFVMNEKPRDELAIDQPLGELVKLLKKKEKDPGSVSLRKLLEILGMGERKKPFERLIRYYLDRPELFVFRYEDYVDGHFEKINKYLGLDLKIAETVPEKRVMRSKTYGNWKDWMTASDVEYYRKAFREYMEMFGYPDDWSLSPVQHIDPALSSQYVERLIRDAKADYARRAKKALQNGPNNK